jgi:hypothetical protein
MPAVLVWKNVRIQMQSNNIVPKTITSITKANPAVVTCSAHGFTTGAYVFLDVRGMRQLSDRVARVGSTTTDTFQLEGIDSSLFDDFVSGSAGLVSFGTSITTATNLTASGGEFDFIDTTTIHDNQRSQVPGLPSAISFSMENLWDASDPGLLAMKYASDNQLKRAFKIQFGDSGKLILFAGYVGCTMLPGGNALDKVTTQSVITINGLPTYYAS